MGTEKLDHTYVAAIQHDLVDMDESSKLLGVVRKPTPWFHSNTDGNFRELGPPEDLLNEFQERRDDLKMQGMCEEGAHNAAWDETEFEERYLNYLRSTEEARNRIDEITDLIENDGKVVLVCYENTEKKMCHRVPLIEEMERILSK